MKRYHWMLMALMSAGTLLAAPEEPAASVPDAAMRRRPRHVQNMSDEERQALQQRRFEIMALLQTYQILPEKDRAAVKAELEKRIAADLAAELAHRKAKLAAFEEGIAKMKQEIAERERSMDQAVAAELERLLALPMPPPPPPGQRTGMTPQQSGQPEQERENPPPRPSDAPEAR